MAGDITTTIRELLDNSDVLAKIEKAKKREEDLKKVQEERGKVAVSVLRQELRERERVEAGQVTFTQATQAQTAATRQLSQGLGSLSQQLADVAVGLQGGQKPMTILFQQGPQIGDIFRTNAALAGAFSGALTVLGTSLIGAVATAGPLYNTYQQLGDENERLIALTDATSESIAALAEEVNKIVDAQIELEQREGVLAGTVSEETVRQTKAQAEATELYAGSIDQLKTNIKEYEKAIRETEAKRGTLTDLFDLSQLFGGESSEDKVRRYRGEIANLRENIGELSEESATYATRLEAVTEGEEKATKATKAHTKAIKDALAVAGAEREGRILRDMEIMDEWQAYLRDEAAQEAVIQATIQKGYEDAGAAREAAQIQAVENTKAYLDLLEQQRVSELRAISGAMNTAATVTDAVGSVIDLAMEERTARAQELQDAYDQALEDGDQATAKSLKKRLDAEKEAAMKAWHMQQAAAYATAIAMAAQGVAVAAASYPPPANIPAIVAAGVVGAANVAAVAATPPPEFDDTPGVVRAGMGDRTIASFKGGDYIAAAQDPAELMRQVLQPVLDRRSRRTDYRAPGTIRTSVYIGASQAASIEAVADVNRRGTSRGARPLGRRVASSGGAG